VDGAVHVLTDGAIALQTRPFSAPQALFLPICRCDPASILPDAGYLRMRLDARAPLCRYCTACMTGSCAQRERGSVVERGQAHAGAVRVVLGGFGWCAWSGWSMGMCRTACARFPSLRAATLISAKPGCMLSILGEGCIPTQAIRSSHPNASHQIKSPSITAYT